MKTIFLDRRNLTEVDEFTVRQAVGVTAQFITTEHLIGSNYRVAIESDKPICEPWQNIDLRYENGPDGYLHQKWTVTESSEQKIAWARQDIADKRWQIESSGVDFDGVTIPTDRMSQTILTSMNLRVDRNPDYTTSFKVASGQYLTVGRDEIIAMGDAVFAHVDAAFQRERELNEQLDNGIFVTSADW